MSKEITIEIDGIKINTPASATIIEAADEAGIYIPRFCYHKKLSVAANCRMCLVEVAKVPKALPACATPIMPGMVVKTKSKLAIDAQRAIMEFLLINHPLDCPVCDQGGECELQDVSMGYGAGFSQYQQPKRSVIKEDLGPLLDTGMTRCIHCTRCVRFGDEVAGLRELGATGRGEDMSIGTYVKHFVKSEVSGNVIDLCPVGALTSKPSRLSLRSWELQAAAMISPHDSLGSHLEVHTKGHANHSVRDVMRVVPREADDLNENWLSDRDRFSYEALYHSDRLQEPMIKIKGEWKRTSWQKILPQIAAHLEVLLVNNEQQNSLGCLVSPQATVEEMYLLQKVMRHLGVTSIDHRIRMLDFSDQHNWPSTPHTASTLEDIEQAQKILLIGANVRHDIPLLGLRVRSASLAENAAAKVMLINCVDDALNFTAAQKIICAIEEWESLLSQVLFLLAQEIEHDLVLVDKPLEISAEARQLVTNLNAPGETTIILGLEALHHPCAARVRELAAAIAYLVKTPMVVLTDGANSAGAALSGCLPHRLPGGVKSPAEGLNAREMFSQPQQAYWLHGVEPELDCAEPGVAVSALKAASYVICCNSYVTDAMLDYADILLPLAPWTEVAGTFINMFATQQSFAAATIPHYDSKPGWKILRVLGKLLGCPDCGSEHTAQVLAKMHDEIKASDPAALKSVQSSEHISEKVDLWSTLCKRKISLLGRKNKNTDSSTLLRYAPWGLYDVDPIVRRAASLQKMFEATGTIKINQSTAIKLNLTEGALVIARQGAQEVLLPLAINNSLCDNIVELAGGASFSSGFGAAWSGIELRRADNA